MDAASTGGEAVDPGERPPRARLLPWIVLTVAIGTVVTDAMTRRDLSAGEDDPEWSADPGLLSYKLMRLATVLVLAVSASAVVRGALRRGFPRAGLPVWLGYMGFVATCFVLPGLTGRVPGFDVRLLYPPLAFTAVYFARPVSTAGLATLSRVVLGASVYGSLVAALVLPSQALAANYVGFFPWLDFRLYGVGGGATSLGMVSSTFLALEMVSPSRSRWRFLHLAAGTTALFLTQAKTSWLFVLAVVAYFVLRRLSRRLASLTRPAGVSVRVLAFAAVGSGLLALAGLTGYQLSRLDVDSLRGGENLATLTGRTYIWATSLNTWLDDPLFGYGLGLWEGEYRAKYAPLYPHAHNQFIQTLASAGLVGLLGLLAYLWAAWRSAIRAAPTTPVPAVLLAAILSQCLTNVPLRGQYLLEPLVVVHLLMFAALVNGDKLVRAAAEGLEGGIGSAVDPEALTRNSAPAAP